MGNTTIKQKSEKDFYWLVRTAYSEMRVEDRENIARAQKLCKEARREYSEQKDNWKNHETIKMELNQLEKELQMGETK